MKTPGEDGRSRGALAREIVELYDNAPCGYHSIDASGTLVRVNDTELRWLGYTRDEVVGKLKTSDIFAAPSLALHTDYLSRLEGGEWNETIELEMVRKDGSIMPVLLRSTAACDHDDGRSVARSSVFDLTERRRLEQELNQARKMEAMGQLAGGVAHDFNNLLTIIHLHCELLQNGLEADHPARRDLEVILEAVDQGTSVTQLLLAFGRKQSLAPRVLDLNQVITSLGKVLRRLIGENVSLRTELDGSLYAILADPGQMQQVIINLAVNARDAMPSGGRLTIGTANLMVPESDRPLPSDPAPGSYATLRVSDTGCGMDSRVRSRLFEPFFTTKPAGKGTGLGLASVYGVVCQSQGRIQVESVPGVGSTFTMSFPAVEEATSDSGAALAPGRPTPRGSETILVVEDESFIRKLCCRILSERGFRVLEAEDGCEALQLCESLPTVIHLMLSDLIMPRLGGRELAKLLAPIRPAMRIVFMTGYPDQDPDRTSYTIPASCLLHKPFSRHTLLRAIREALDGDGPALG